MNERLSPTVANLAPETVESVIMTLPIERIQIDERIKPRQHFDNGLAGQYADLLCKGSELDPIDVFEDAQGIIRLADGLHRLRAHQRAHRADIRCRRHLGGAAEAHLFAAGSNLHGCPRKDWDLPYAIRCALVGIAELTDESFQERFRGSSGKAGAHARTGWTLPALATLVRAPRATIARHIEKALEEIDDDALKTLVLARQDQNAARQRERAQARAAAKATADAAGVDDVPPELEPEIQDADPTVPTAVDAEPVEERLTRDAPPPSKRAVTSRVSTASRPQPTAAPARPDAPASQSAAAYQADAWAEATMIKDRLAEIARDIDRVWDAFEAVYTEDPQDPRRAVWRQVHQSVRQIELTTAPGLPSVGAPLPAMTNEDEANALAHAAAD